ncbi:TRIM56 [Acanthosepion pharaonis]|uniref:TRIM56 n=1 Tax=Acanthosepion pharaonis TaxID=158019 RepID=A0A812CFJ4_ACAPH|nr:TRIM56 [Sepia pharaonis]
MLNVTVKAENWKPPPPFSLFLLPFLSFFELLFSPSLFSLISTLSVPHSLTISFAPTSSTLLPTPTSLISDFRRKQYSFRESICFSYIILFSEQIFQMASNMIEEETFQCSKCIEVLDLASKTLPCLHSFCGTCVKIILEGNGLCPQCQQPATGDDLRLAPFLVKSLRRRQLESSEMNCDTCFEDGIESAGQNWCQDCQKLLCQTCERFHKKFHRGHETKDLSGVSRFEAIRVITMEDCRRHRQSKDVFCDRCNVCMCDACYTDHLTASLQCPSRPLSVREEASKGKEERGPTLERELRQFEINIRATNERTRRSIEELSTDCDTECSKLWQDFETFVEETRIKLGELCENMRGMASELERKWRHSLKEREELLGKVKIWRVSLGHLLMDDTDDEDVVCGLRLLGAELSARLHQSFAPPEKGHWVVTFPKWCHDSLESLKKEMIDWTPQTSGYLQLESECHLQGSYPWLWQITPWIISSIVVSDKDNHVFVGDRDGGSVLEFRDSGEFVGQFRLKDGRETFFPWDMCRLPEDILVVCCPGWSGLRVGGRLFFLARQKSPPFLKKQKIIDIKEKNFFSLCQIDKKIFACDLNFEEIVCFNENGEKIKTIHPGGAPGRRGYPRLHYDFLFRYAPFVHHAPRLRADPMTGNFFFFSLSFFFLFFFFFSLFSSSYFPSFSTSFPYSFFLIFFSFFSLFLFHASKQEMCFSFFFVVVVENPLNCKPQQKGNNHFHPRISLSLSLFHNVLSFSLLSPFLPFNTFPTLLAYETYLSDDLFSSQSDSLSIYMKRRKYPPSLSLSLSFITSFPSLSSFSLPTLQYIPSLIIS